jgi:uncharacterized protein (UPF0261 family)
VLKGETPREATLSKRHILVLGTTDTKGKELLFLKEQIQRREADAFIIDVSMGKEPLFEAEVGPAEIAHLGGMDIDEVRLSDDRNRITEVMERGAIEKVKQIHSAGEVGAIMAVGGVTMALFGAHVMKELPFGIPKFIVCPGAMPAFVPRWFGAMDMIVMQCLVDFAGLNPLVQNVLTRVAGAICGMVGKDVGSIPQLAVRSIAITELGYSENCARLVRQHLEAEGYSVYPFHAQGIGDRAMDDLLQQGFFDGVIEIVPAGVIEEMFAGTRAAGPKRLEAAGERGLPQVVATCSVNITNAGPARREAEKYIHRERKLKQDELRILTRYNEAELVAAAEVYASKLNKARGPVRILVPTQGWSSLDKKGSILHAPEEDKVFIEELRRHLKREIEIQELDCHLEDPEFAFELASAFLQIDRAKERSPQVRNT